MIATVASTKVAATFKIDSVFTLNKSHITPPATTTQNKTNATPKSFRLAVTGVDLVASDGSSSAFTRAPRELLFLLAVLKVV
jgi:hypothetical protein